MFTNKVNFLLALTLSVSNICCQTKPAPAAPVAPVANLAVSEVVIPLPDQRSELISIRTDLPPGWFEVKGFNNDTYWSYGLPTEFSAVTQRSSTTVLAQHYSNASDLVVRFHSNRTTENSTPEFLKNRSAELSNRSILSIRSSIVGDKQIYAIHSIVLASMEATLDFFIWDKKVAQHLSCTSSAKNLKIYSSTCFAIADTLQVHY